MSSQAGKTSTRLWNVACCFVAGVLLVAGCEVQAPAEKDMLATGPDPDVVGAVSEKAARVIAAAGGLDVWSKAGKIDLSFVATFYREDGTYYLSEQGYEIYPWSNSVRISGREPGGDYSWQLQQGRFGVLQGLSQYEGLGVGVDNGCIAEGILALVTAPVRLLDKDVEFKWSAETVKLGGQWYEPVKRMVKRDVVDVAALRDAAFYQRRSTERMDMVLLGCGNSRDVLVVRGHDYRLLGRDGVMVPARIELFNADAGGRVKRRIIQLDLK